MTDEARILFQEKEINKSLKSTLKTYFALKRAKRDDLANAVLQFGSTTAKSLMLLAGIKSKKVFCKQCGRQLKYGYEIEFYKKYGFCLSCDHIYLEGR